MIERVAREAWPAIAARHDGRDRPAEPTLVLLAGPPLAGKTTIAQALVEALPVATVHVENDRLRSRVAAALGRESPRFDGEEDQATYRAARALIEQGLEAGMHVVHDATNLREARRARAYRIADRYDAPVRVLVLKAPEPVREDRAHEEGPAAEQAHAALGARTPEAGTWERPHVQLDGTQPPAGNVARLLQDAAFEHLIDAQPAHGDASGLR